MPSSLLVVVLVAAWLVVLVPMVAKHRQEVRRTGDAVLAARVLHHGGSDARLRRPGPAAGHRSDPDWRAHEYEYQYEYQEAAMDDERFDAHSDNRVEEYAEAEYAPQRNGRGGYDPQADAVSRMARFAFRRRLVLGLLVGAVLTAIVAAVSFSSLWTVHALLDVGLVGYLVYLRSQVRIEEDVRARRVARMGRARLGVDSKVDEAYGEVPQRLRRPGAIVLEIDDEDPAFDELDDLQFDYEMDLPRASGQ
ncbi:MAG: divisome protein SepX/GlpR [Mycobacteriaceae bacterium]